MIFIQDLKEGQRVSQIWLCKTKVNGTTKNGRSYYSLKLQDKTGVADGKVWDLSNSIEHFEANAFIYSNEVACRLKQLFLTDESQSVRLTSLPSRMKPRFLVRLWESIIRMLAPLM